MVSSLRKMPTPRCNWCGEEEPWLWIVTYGHVSPPGVASVCSTCKRRADYFLEESFATKGLRRNDPPPVPDPPPSDEGFAPLFAAARTLLDEGVEAEETIIPTLAFVAERIRGSDRHAYAWERLAAAWQDPKTRKEEIARFEAVFKRLKLLGMKDDTLMVEQRAVWGDISLGARDGGLTGVQPAFLVILEVDLNRKLADPDQVARCYSDILAAEGLGCGSWDATDFSHYYYHSSLRLKVMNNRLPSEYRRSLIDLAPHPAYLRDYLDRYRQGLDMPHPKLVRRHYESLLNSRTDSDKGLGQHATARRRGGSFKARNLVLACVAWYLRYYGKEQGRQRVHELLNEEVVRDGLTLPLNFSDSQSSKLWESVKRLSPRLLAESRA